MKRSIVIFLVTIFAMCFARVTYASDVVKLGASIEEKYLKDSYNANDKIIINITIEEECPNLGLIIGMLEYDDSILEVNNLIKGGIDIIEDGEVEGKIMPSMFDSGVGDFSNQIIFWIEDAYNRLTKGIIGRVSFIIKKDVELKDIKFAFANVKASDYKESVQYNVQQVIENKPVSKTLVTDKEDDSLDKIQEEKKAEEARIKEAIIKKTSEKKSSSSSKSNSNVVKEEPKAKIWNKASSWAEVELEEANSQGLVPDTFSNKDFTNAITRKDFAAVAVKLCEKLTNKESDAILNNPFIDTNDEYVLKAYKLGITNGTSKEKFSPDNEITREQMATMILRALEKAGIKTDVNIDKVTQFIDDEQMHDWSRNAIYFMSDAGIINGISSKENRYGVKSTATMEQALVISLRSVKTFKR